MPGSSAGANLSADILIGDPHAALAALRATEPVCWVPALGGWLVTGYEPALTVMRDSTTFTVDDPRFTTAQVVGPSMLSLDLVDHARHRAAFAAPFRPRAVREVFERIVAEESARLLDRIAEGPAYVDLRSTYAGPLAAVVMAHALGLGTSEVPRLLAWYAEIVAGVNELTAGKPLPLTARDAYSALAERLLVAMRDEGGGSLLSAATRAGALEPAEVLANAAVLLFGGIDTTEGAILNALLALLSRPDELARVRAESRADGAHLAACIEEATRLEPAAAMVDRYATEDCVLAGAAVASGDLLHVSLTAANRDPEVFAEPDRFDPLRRDGRRHLAYAQGPHVCVGVHLAQLEVRVAISALLDRFPALALNAGSEIPAARGLVFRKPPTLCVSLT